MKPTSNATVGGTQSSILLFDIWLVFAVLGIIGLGLLMVASASFVVSDQQYGQPFHYLFRQLSYLSIGFVAFAFVVRIKSEHWEKASTTLLFIAFALLIVVLIPGIGRTVNGSARWVGVGPINLQVSEFAKLAAIIFMGSYLVRRSQEVQHSFAGFVKPMVLLGIMALLLLKEPDFGATTVILITCLSMLFLGGARLRYFGFFLSIIIIAMAILAVSSPYRLARLTSFLNPWAAQYGGGYQLTQSLIAFGRGGWFGVGLGDSVQKLFYLPEAHTDFLFAVLAEELGLVGVLSVIGLFSLLVTRIFIIARMAVKQGELFCAYVAYGVGCWFGLQAMINIGVNSGVLPTKGLTLPFMSYGGSSLVIMLMVIAIILRIDYELRVRTMGFYSQKRGFANAVAS